MGFDSSMDLPFVLASSALLLLPPSVRYVKALCIIELGGLHFGDCYV